MREKTNLLSKISRKEFYNDLHDLIISELECIPYFSNKHLDKISDAILKCFIIARREEELGKWMMLSSKKMF